MKPLLFAPGVEAEIEAAGDYYENQRAGLGSEFLDAVDDALERLVEQPRAHGLAFGAGPDDEIRQVLARGYWRSRGER